jgi:uncharacterized RDD family membrane protein YckC
VTRGIDARLARGDDLDQTGVVLRRYAQHAIELLLLLVAGLVSLVLGVVLAVALVRWGAPPALFPVLPFAVLVVVILLGTVWFEVWFPHRHGGATPGMRWLGLRIVAVDGGTPALRDYAVRWLLMVVDGMCFGLVGAVLIAVTPRRQRLGDMVAGTVVVRAARVS